MEFDCEELLGEGKGENYAHEYAGYLNFFALLGNATKPIKCRNVPSCWAPFVCYLGHAVESTADHWDLDGLDWHRQYLQSVDKRRVVEVASAARPELVHALYLADTEWPCPLRSPATPQKEFVVTCNGSYFRPEIRAYQQALAGYAPAHTRAVIVPCAAAKPYPAPLHRAVIAALDRLGLLDRWHLIIATGVLGLVPEDLWDEMPLYDSGMPNWERCRRAVEWYFTRHPYKALVVYSDFYAPAIYDGLYAANFSQALDTEFVLGWHWRDSYENLLLPEHLQRLEVALARAEKRANGGQKAV